MRHIWFSSLFIGVCCLSMGMGTLGDQSAVITPEPDKNYAATVVDQSDVSIELEKFSCVGLTYLTGRLGKADLSIDFEKIRSILFVTSDEGTKAVVNLDNQERVEVLVDKDTPCYGESSFADVRIQVGDIKKVVLHGPAKAVE